MPPGNRWPRLRRSWTLFATLSIVASSGACGDGKSITTQPTYEMSATAYQYLDGVVGVMQDNSVRRRKINWETFRTTVFQEAKGAQTIADIYPAIRAALVMLGDGHSQYRPPSGATIFVPTHNCTAPASPTPVLPPNIGYVRVGSFNGTSAQAQAFADSIQATIRAADRDDLIGWIVDLRRNGGGNMWPMIAGLGPILGDGVLGFFVDPYGVTEAWSYHSGIAWLGSTPLQRVTQRYRLRRDLPRVAVLTDNLVASSGEASVIAFRQRPFARSFGGATCGLSTANASYDLPDGALLILTVSTMADRQGVMYGEQVTPDEVVTDPVQMVARAVEWLQAGN